MAEFNWDQYQTITPKEVENKPSSPIKKSDSFNWDEYKTSDSKQGITQGESFARGVAQGASLGFADEVSGGVEALWQKAQGNPTEFGKLYALYRDQSRENFKKAKDENPGSFLSGEIGGGIATAFVPGVAAAKGAKLANIAARAAGVGAASGAGYSEGETPLEVAKDTAIGATVGGITAAAAPYAGKALSAIGNKSKDLAEKFGARAIGVERATAKKLGDENIKEVGRHAIDNLISPLASTDDLIARNEAIKTASMNARKAAYDQIDKAGKSTFNPFDVASKVEQKVLEGKNTKYLDTQDLIKKLNPEIDNILSRGDGNITMDEAQKLVESLGKKAKFDTSRSNESNELAKNVYGVVREEINKAAEKGADSINLGKVVRDSNKLFSTAKKAESLLVNKSAREQGNKFIGLTDWAVIGGGAPEAVRSGGDTLASTVGLLGVKKGLERFGSQNTALALDRASRIMTQAPKAAESIARNPTILDQAAIEPITQKASSMLQNVADKEKRPLKGPDKWAYDGVEKIIEHDKNGEINDSAVIQELLKTKQGKKLLIEASDLTPGSKAMEGVMQKIRTGYLNKGGE